MSFLLIAPTNEPRSVRHVETLTYPDLALSSRIEGEVKLSVSIGPDGVVATAFGSGHPFLLQSAEENIHKWKFSQGQEETIKVAYKFILRDPAVNVRVDTECLFDLPNQVSVITQKLNPNIDTVPMGKHRQH